MNWKFIKSNWIYCYWYS